MSADCYSEFPLIWKDGKKVKLWNFVAIFGQK